VYVLFFNLSFNAFHTRVKQQMLFDLNANIA
jgi:hypothetical protein